MANARLKFARMKGVASTGGRDRRQALRAGAGLLLGAFLVVQPVIDLSEYSKGHRRSGGSIEDDV
jgi:hypothetical protein